ncbi:MAG: hypothetical protein DHS20C18_30200 [Saprospiraceae bacterium]|nr:MAG: hypothetical protein DHS20C18_30200 [Saprospiraceae bacterium]
MSEETGKKRILSRWDVIWLVVVFAILASVVMEKLGMPIVDTTEKTEMVNKPHRD